MVSAMHEFDCVIVGAGLAGVAAAVVMARDGVLSGAVRIRRVREARGGRVLRTVPIERYWMSHPDIVKAIE